MKLSAMLCAMCRAGAILTLAHAGVLLLALVVGAAWRGDVIVFTRARESMAPHLVLRDVGRSVEAALMTDDVYPSLPTWSPDGAWLAWLTHQQWRLLRWADLAVRPLAQGLPGGTMIAWSPDSQRVVFERLMTSGERRLMTVKVAGGTPQFLANSIGIDQVAPAWSPDGRWLAYHAKVDNRGDHVMLYEWATQQTTIISDEHSALAAWSPDSRKVAYWHDMTALAIYSLDERITRLYPLERPADIGPPTWSPDGRWIAFAVGGEMIGLLDTTTERFLGRRLPNVVQYAPRWSADGRSLLAMQIGPWPAHLKVVQIDADTGAWRTLTPLTLIGSELMPTWMP